MSGRPIHEKSSYYESAEFNLGTVTNYDVATNITNLFGGTTSKMKHPGKVRGRLKLITNKDLTLRYNDVNNDAITVTSSESPYIEEEMALTNLFITNSTGQTASVKIRLYLI